MCCGQAARVLENCHLKSDEEEHEQQKLLVRVFLNIALCCLKLKQNGLAITYCHRVLALQPNNVKALFRKGQVGLVRRACWELGLLLILGGVRFRAW